MYSSVVRRMGLGLTNEARLSRAGSQTSLAYARMLRPGMSIVQTRVLRKLCLLQYSVLATEYGIRSATVSSFGSI